MSSRTPTCDSNQLEALLECGLNAEQERDVMAHLDVCERCRYELESRAAEPASWDEARAYLTRRRDEPAADDDGGSPANRPLQIQHVLDALAPTDDPQMLGRLGGYEVSGVVGTGGMGVVLKAHDNSLDRTVAIKVLAPHLASSGAARKRFSREAKAAAAVLHPNVMAIHSVSNGESLPYLVMPYVRGQSLQKRIDAEGPLRLQDILRIGTQIAAGLSAAHQQGLVHRDIKPANILLNDGVDRLVITDFGLARAVDDASVTRTGVIAGTPQYMSPEQARGETVDCRSDLFSLGSVMYTLCVGHPPFRAESAYGILRRITDNAPRPIRETNPDIPEWLCRIIEKLMAKRPDERFASAEEVAELLRDCLAHLQQPTTVPLPSSVEQLSQSLPRAACKQKQLEQEFNIPTRMIIAAAFAFALIFAGVLIVLEMNKAKLTIECVADDVPIRIIQGDEVVKRLTVSKSGKTVRVAAGNYQVEIEGNMDGISVDGGVVSLSRGGVKTVKIVSSTNTFNTGKAENSLTYKLQPVPEAPPFPEQAPNMDERLKAKSLVGEGQAIQLFFNVPPRAHVCLVVPTQASNSLNAQLASLAIHQQGTVFLFVPQGGQQTLHITQLPQLADQAVFVTFQVAQLGDALAAELKHHSGFAFELSDEDIRHVASGKRVTKVLRATPVRGTKLDVLITDQDDFEPDPMPAASLMEPVIAVLQLSGKATAAALPGQKKYPGTVGSFEAERTHRASEKPPATVEAGASLLEIVREFNQQQQQNPIGKDQPPLTDDEVIASIRWAVMSDGQDEISDPYRQQLRQIVEQRQLPSQWAFEVVTEVEGTDGERFRAWFIRLVYSGTPGVPPYNHAIRDQLLWQLDVDGQAIELGQPESGDVDADSKPLAAAIHGFNLSHRQLAGLDMPPLTEQEVIAAIRYQKLRRNEFDVTDGEFAKMQQIADKRRLPADAEISVVKGFQPGDGYRYDIWSVRFSMRKQVNTVPHPFTGFTIREHYVRSQSLDLDKIAWGPVAENGLQAGVRFEPRQAQYSIGQKVTPYFYYRNTGDQKFDISFPNMESGKLVAVDNAGAAIPFDTDKNPKWIVGAMGLGEFGFGSQHEICGRPIILGDVERGDAEFAVRAQAGQAVRVHFVLSNYADRDGSQLQTGEVAFSMAPAVEGEAVIGREIQLQSVEAAWLQAVLADVYGDQIRDENLSITVGTSPKSIIVRGPAKLVTEVAKLIARLDISVVVMPIDGEKDPGKASEPNGALSAWDDQAEFSSFDQDLMTLESETDPLWDDHSESVPSDILRDASESREQGN